MLSRVAIVIVAHERALIVAAALVAVTYGAFAFIEVTSRHDPLGYKQLGTTDELRSWEP